MNVNDLKSKMVSGAIWMTAFRVVERAIGFVSIVVLARVLSPADFGLVAMATAIIAILELLGAFSFDAAIIQSPNAGKEHLNTVWTISVLMNGFNAAALCALALPAAWFYDEARLVPIVYWLAASLLLGGFANVGVVLFQKEMNFSREFVFQTSKKLARVIATLGFALLLGNYWALVFGSITGAAVTVLLSYVMHPFRPHFSLVALKELIHFSKWMYLNNLLLFLNRRSPDLIVGKLNGPHSLGLFSMALEVATTPTMEIVAPINRVVFPGFSRMHADLRQLKDAYLRVASLVALLAIPAGVGIAMVALPLVRLAMGEKWLEAVPLIQLLAIYGTLSALAGNSGMLYLSLGKTRLLATMSAGLVAVLVPGMIIASWKFGAVGAASMFVACSAGILVVDWIVISRVLQMRVTEMVRNVVRPAASAAAMVIALTAFHQWLQGTHELSVLVELSVKILIGALVYVSALTMLWLAAGRPSGAERWLLKQMQTFALRLKKV